MKSRWQKSLLAAVAPCEAQMPWARGARRKAMIARRNAKTADRQDGHRIKSDQSAVA